MAGTRERLDRLQEMAILALLSSRTQAEAAAKVGIGVNTIRRWLTDSAFQETYQAAKRRTLEIGLANICQRAAQ